MCAAPTTDLRTHPVRTTREASNMWGPHPPSQVPDPGDSCCRRGRPLGVPWVWPDACCRAGREAVCMCVVSFCVPWAWLTWWQV